MAYMNSDRHQTTKLWTVTLRKLKIISALTGEPMVKIMDRLADVELERVRADERRLLSRDAS